MGHEYCCFDGVWKTGSNGGVQMSTLFLCIDFCIVVAVTIIAELAVSRSSRLSRTVPVGSDPDVPDENQAVEGNSLSWNQADGTDEGLEKAA
jgi:hypothetical protein